MKVIVKNSSSDELNFSSGAVTIPAESSVDVSSLYWFGLYTDLEFIKNLRNNNLVLNDGNKDLRYPESETYLEYVNSFNYNNKDIDGALIVRTKAAKKGWSFWAIAPEITTSTLTGSLFCQDFNGNNISWINCKIYNSDNEEITTAGLLNANLATCVKTVLDFEPTFDFEIIGGALRVNSNPSQDIRLWIVGAPDIPANLGGSKEFASGINLKFLAPDSSFDIDGRVTKFLTYNPITHQGKMRMILRHPPGLQVNLQFIVHIYRQ